MIDDAKLNSIAARTGVPPSLLKATLRQQLPATVTSLYPEASSDEAFAAEAVAQTLSQNFNRTGSWDSAIAGYLTGNTHLDHNSPIGQQVNTLLASSLIGADQQDMTGYGVGGYNPQAGEGFLALGRSAEQFVGQGGAIGQQHVSWAQAAAQQAQRGYASQAQSSNGSAPPYPGIASVPGSSPQPGGNLAGSGATQLQASPFGSSAPGITQGFGQSGEQGADYGTTEHTPVFSGFSGTVHVEHFGSGYTGLSVYVDNGQGWQFFVGHLYNTNLQDGQQIQAGNLIGYSGGGKDAPEPGHTSGPHVEIQVRQALPGGQYRFYNPADVVQQAERGIFAPDVVKAAQSAVQQNFQVSFRPQQKQSSEPHPQDIESFADRAKGAGITDPQVIVDTLPKAATLYRQITGKPPTMQELASHAGQTQGEIATHLAAQPHPVYSNVAMGDMRKTFYAASLHSVPKARRMPTLNEAAQFSSAGWGDKQISDYYANIGENDMQPGQQKPQASNVISMPGMKAS